MGATQGTLQICTLTRQVPTDHFCIDFNRCLLRGIWGACLTRLLESESPIFKPAVPFPHGIDRLGVAMTHSPHTPRRCRGDTGAGDAGDELSKVCLNTVDTLPGVEKRLVTTMSERDLPV